MEFKQLYNQSKLNYSKVKNLNRTMRGGKQTVMSKTLMSLDAQNKMSSKKMEILNDKFMDFLNLQQDDVRKTEETLMNMKKFELEVEVLAYRLENGIYEKTYFDVAKKYVNTVLTYFNDFTIDSNFIRKMLANPEKYNEIVGKETDEKIKCLQLLNDNKFAFSYEEKTKFVLKEKDMKLLELQPKADKYKLLEKFLNESDKLKLFGTDAELNAALTRAEGNKKTTPTIVSSS